jgi:hypothetical protein
MLHFSLHRLKSMLRFSLHRLKSMLQVFWFFLCLGACQTDHFEQTKALMKGGKLQTNINQKTILACEFVKSSNCLSTTYDKQKDLLTNQPCCGVYTIQVVFPTDTTSYRFIVDTGSPTVISAALARKLNRKILCSYQDDLYENKPIFDVTQLDILQLPTQNEGTKFLVFEQIAAVVDSFPPHSFLASFDGIIGANVMQHAIWQFDGLQKTVALLDKASYEVAKKNAMLVPMFRNIYRVPKFHGFINQYQTKSVFHLSTGFGGGVKIPAEYWQHCNMLRIDSTQNTQVYPEFCVQNYIIEKEKLANKVANPTNLPLNSTLNSRLLYINQVRIDTLARQHISTVFSEGTSWQLGNDFLQHYVLTVDWKGRCFFLSKKQRYLAPKPTQSTK